MFFVGMLNSIAMYPNELAIFYRECDDNSYPLEAFFIYYSALEIPMELLASFLFSLLTVPAAGLPRTPALFFLTSYIAFCAVSCGQSVGIVFLALLSHTGLAVSTMSVILAISIPPWRRHLAVRAAVPAGTESRVASGVAGGRVDIDGRLEEDEDQEYVMCESRT